MNPSDEKLLDWLDELLAGRASGDILQQAPDLSVDDAYRLQFAWMRRLVARGDRVVGYKAAYTSVVMQKMFNIPGPAIGTLLASGVIAEDEPFTLPKDGKTNIEPEIAVVMGRVLAGPGVTNVDVLNAIDGFMPAIEIAPPPVGGRDRSRQMGTVVHKTSGGIVLGPMFSSVHGIDLRTEGAVVSINGVPRGSGTGVEVLGNPISVVAEIANLLGGFGEKLTPGMVIMTGSIVGALQVFGGDRVLVEFTRLGSVRAVFQD